jgi:hypothetical protein
MNYEVKTTKGVTVTFCDPDYIAPPAHGYTVGRCKAIAYNVPICELEAHINTLGALYNSDQDHLVGQCLEILEDCMQDRTHAWDSALTVNIDEII